VLGHDTTVCDAQWPTWNEEYLKEAMVNYGVSFNGKSRYTITVPADADEEEVKRLALTDAGAERWLDGKEPRKIIFVKGKLVNIVV